MLVQLFLFANFILVSFAFRAFQNTVPSFRVRNHFLSMAEIEKSRFLNKELALNIKANYGTPVYVYDEATLVHQAQQALQFPNLFGLTVRYAMKASPNAAILRLFKRLGLNFDASSGYEVRRAILAGIEPREISLSSQELPHDFQELIQLGIEFNACSLTQLETFGKLFPGGSCGVRFNPGKGSGGTGKTVSDFELTDFQCIKLYDLECRRTFCIIWDMA
jgi:diaminopimelate decarboxylase